MRTTWLGGPRVLFSLLLMLASAVPAVAQQRDVNCRCVDANGNPIENCTCFRTPIIREPLVRMFGAARARIGVSLEESADGAAITQVADDSPAQAAGLAVGDVITRLDGRSLLEPLADAARERRIDENGEVAVQRLMAMAQDWDVGDAVQVEYLRNGQRRTVELTTQENPTSYSIMTDAPGRVRVFGRSGDGDAAFRPYVFGPDSNFDFFNPDGRARIMLDSISNMEFPRGSFRFSVGCRRGGDALVMFGADCVDGIRLIELNPELGDYFGTSTGVLVTEVDDATTLGLQPGDVVLSIDGRAVTTPEQVSRIVGSYGNGEEIRFRVRRRNQETEVTGTRR
jgi:predicted metalloprotease with PDZ domain